MQLQASYIIRELKELLRHRKYKYVVNRVERLLDKEEEFEYFCIEFHLNLRLLQLAAVNRLLQRNLVKKYKYALPILEFLVELALRNLAYCHQALKEKVKEKTIFTKFNLNGTDGTFTLNSHTNSLDEHCSNEVRSRNYSIRVNSGLQTQQKLKQFLRKFFEMANRSVLLIMQSFMIYRLDIEEGVLAEYIKNQSEAKFKNISGSISHINMLLFNAKLLFLSQERGDHLRCEQTVEQAIQRLIDVMHQINISSCRAASKEGVGAGGGTGRYQKWLEECQKLIVIALVLNNKTKMKLGKETVALAGIDLFQSYLQGLPAQLKNFRRLMLPELYLQQQFLRYRAEKSELTEIVTPFFPEKVKQIEEANRQRECSRHRLMDFYNKRNVKLAEKAVLKPRALLAQLNTVKSIMATTRHKNNVSIQSKTTKERSSYDCKNKIITNMIIADISELNAHYLKFKKLNPPPTHTHTATPTPTRKESIKSNFYKSNTQSALKRQAVCRTGREERKNDDSITYQTERQRALFVKETEYKHYVNQQKDRLTRRKKQIKLEASSDQLHIQEEIQIIKENLASGHLHANYKYTEQKSIDIEERDVRKNMVAITSRRKTELFIEVLFLNKELLGIRKIAEKVESLRKKEQEKAKSMNNRLTSSINREQSRGSFVKFEVIAKELIRKHISFAYDKPIPQSPSDYQQNKRKLIQANYLLGQRSIEAVKEKLQSKINKNEYSVDKYLKNEEVFKLKLKKLGTTNFILKKNGEEKEQPQAQPEGVECL